MAHSELARWDNHRIICKHFNLSYLDIKYRISLGDYWCMLADAMYAEESDDWTFTALTHGSDGVKHWSQPTLAVSRTFDRVQRQTRSLTNRELETAGIYLPPDFSEKKQERMAFFEKATGGRRIIFRLDDGSHTDRLGNPIAELRESDLIIPRRTANG